MRRDAAAMCAASVVMYWQGQRPVLLCIACIICQNLYSLCSLGGAFACIRVLSLLKKSSNMHAQLLWESKLGVNVC